MSLIQPIIGHLLSKYDQTAIEGIDKIIALATVNDVGTSGASKGVRFADEFVSDAQALAALSKFFSRQNCDVAIGFRACITLLQSAQQGNRAAFARYLCRQAFLGPIRKLLNTISEDNMASTCGCLSLMTYLMKHFPKLVLAKLNREVPIALGIFKHLTVKTASLRAYRCLFLAQFALTSFPQINEKTVTTHGYLTHLVEDAAELATSKEHALEGPIVTEAIEAVLTAVRDAFIVSPHLSKNTKREVLMGQRNVLRALVRWLSDDKYGADVLALMQRLIAELHEESFDYFLHRSEDSDAAPTAAAAANNGGANNAANAEFYMPNFSLLAILRLLKPKSFVLHTRLVVFILQKSPDLMRPYFNRVAQHMFEEDRTVSKTNHFAAVVNIMCRVACCPIPRHIADANVAVINTTSEPNTFFTMTPKAVAEEVCPRGLGEFVHRMINKSDNCLHLLMALQVTYAVLRRAEETLACARVVLNLNADKVSAVDAETFLAAAEHELREHLPRTEEFWHRLTQQLLPIAATPKAQYLLQRMYLVVKRYAEVFRLRTPWISAVPAVTVAPRGEESDNAHHAKIGSIADLMKSLANPILQWDGKSVSCLCALLLSNLTMNVSLTKLHHITLGGSEGGNNNTNNNHHHNHNDDAMKQHHKLLEASAKEWPALLSLLHWFVAHASDNSGEAVEAKGFIVHLVLWCVHSVSLRFGATPAEIYLWLSSLTKETAPVLLHLFNNMLQQSTSKAADRVAEQLMKSEHGVLFASAIPFIARIREKAEEKATAAGGEKKSSSSSASAATIGGLWQLDLNQHIDAFEKLTKKVAKKWADAAATYHTEIEVPMGEQLSLQISCLATLRAAALQAREVADVAIPTSAHLVRYMLAHQAPRPATGSQDATCPLPAFVALPEERGDSALLATLQKLDNTETAGSLFIINDTFKDVCKAALAGGSDEATEQFLVSLFATPYAAHTIGRALMDVGRVVNASATAAAAVPKYVIKFIRFILAALADSEGILSKMVLSGEEQGSGFAITLAAAASLIFYTAKTTFANEAAGREELKNAALSIAKNFYGGSLSILDRSCYAAMLLLEIAVQEGSSSTASSSKAPTAFTLAAHSLASLRIARYCVGRMATATASAPEADTLGQLVDGWSDAEIQSLSLATPLKLNNAIRLTAPNTVPNVLRALYPDVGHVSEYELQGRTGNSAKTNSSAADGISGNIGSSASLDAAAAAATSADESRIMDPRFLVPLLRTTGAMCTAHPSSVPSHWIVRCAPFAMVGMSSIDPAMRREASIAFALISNLSGGYVRSVFQFLRVKYGTNSNTANNNAPIPRVPAPLTNFLVSAMGCVASAGHPLHNAVVNQFITPAGASSSVKDSKNDPTLSGPQVLSNPCPMAHLLTEFPIQCIVGEQILSRQEDSFRQGTTIDSGTTAEAAQSITEKLRAEHPPHVDYILRQLRRSLTTKADVEDLIAANVPSNLFLLAGMLRGAPKTRLRVVKTIAEMATTNREVADVWVNHANVRIIEWALVFLLTLGTEIENENGGETTRHKQCMSEMCARLCDMLRVLTIACAPASSSSSSSSSAAPFSASAVANGFSPFLVAQYTGLAKQFLMMRAANSQTVGGVLKQVVQMWEQK